MVTRVYHVIERKNDDENNDADSILRSVKCDNQRPTRATSMQVSVATGLKRTSRDLPVTPCWSRALACEVCCDTRRLGSSDPESDRDRARSGCAHRPVG